MKIQDYKPTFTLATVFLAFTLVGCSKEPSVIEEIIRPVRTNLVSIEAEGWSREFQGVVDASRKADLSFRVSGRLESIEAREGEAVIKGQVIAKLDDADYQITLKDRQANHNVAKADLGRAEKLLSTGSIARAELDTLRAKVITTGTQLESAQKDLEYTILRAPFAGRIAKKYADNHEEVSAKQEIVALQGTDSLLVKVELPESVLIHQGKQTADVRFTAEFSSAPEQLFPLTILEAASQPSSTQTYTVTFSTPYVQEQLILPGMSARVRVTGGRGEQGQILIPAFTIQEDNSGRFVYVVEARDDSLGVVRRREVETGPLSRRGIVIQSGLMEGERLVTAGMSQMTDGMKVRLIEDNVR